MCFGCVAVAHAFVAVDEVAVIGGQKKDNPVARQDRIKN